MTFRLNILTPPNMREPRDSFKTHRMMPKSGYRFSRNIMFKLPESISFSAIGCKHSIAG